MDRTSQAEETVRRYSDMVYRLAFARTGNTADAEDVYQEVFLRYLRSDPQFTSEEHRKAWLIRVTVNCCRNAFGFWETHTVALDEAVQAIPFESPEHGDVYYAMQSLPPRYRTVLHLFYYESMPIREIAAALRKKEGTVKSLLSRGRTLLRERLKEDYDYEETL